MNLEKNNWLLKKQWIMSRLQTLKKRFSDSLFEVMTNPWKTMRAWFHLLRRKKRVLTVYFLRILIISLAVWWPSYYWLFPSKVYQTKRTDRLFESWNEDDLIKQRWMIQYWINDEESTFLIDMLAGMWCHDDWQQYIAEKWYDITDADSIPNDFANRALYIAIRETHKMAFSPKFRIEPRNGDFKDFSNGKIAYTDHRNHTLYSYYLLEKWITKKKKSSLAKFLGSKPYQNDREKLQDALFYHFMSELSHTYALWVYKHEYLNRFIDDVFPSVEIVQDSFPYKIVTRTISQDSLLQYSEHDENTVRLITRYIQKDSMYTDTLFKEDLTHLWSDVYRNTNKYNKSYRDWFEDWIHEWPAENNLERYFMNVYEKNYNKGSNRELYDYARILLWNLWYMHIMDEDRGKKIMFSLAKKWYAPAIRYIKRRTEPSINIVMNHSVWWQRELVSYWEMQICDTQWTIIHCLETYDEKRTINNDNR
jgi:hypothetical protein